jgi:hypothetical protein
VGLEQRKLRSYLITKLLSPSHTVGSELHFPRSLPGIRFTMYATTVAIPHGGLGTHFPRLPRTQKLFYAHNMLCRHPTRWAWNCEISNAPKQEQALRQGRTTVSIPHGGLGTTFPYAPKNRRTSSQKLRPSPSHTVGLEPQTTTLTKIRHINHFVKGAPFSNEVNFPKSEIMQSLVCCYQI